MSKSVPPMFSSRIFMVFSLTFRSLIHFEFSFVYGVRECSNFILLQVARYCYSLFKVKDIKAQDFQLISDIAWI